MSETYNSFLRRTAGWRSLVSRRAHNPKAAGSNPAPATKFAITQSHQWLGFLFWPLVALSGWVLSEIPSIEIYGEE